MSQSDKVVRKALSELFNTIDQIYFKDDALRSDHETTVKKVRKQQNEIKQMISDLKSLLLKVLAKHFVIECKSDMKKIELSGLSLTKSKPLEVTDDFIELYASVAT